MISDPTGASTSPSVGHAAGYDNQGNMCGPQFPADPAASQEGRSSNGCPSAMVRASTQSSSTAVTLTTTTPRFGVPTSPATTTPCGVIAPPHQCERERADLAATNRAKQVPPHVTAMRLASSTVATAGRLGRSACDCRRPATSSVDRLIGT